MSEQVDNGAPRAHQRSALADGLDRIWNEVKEISRQVEHETRKTGRAARLKLDLHNLQREQQEVRARLGKAVHIARQQHGDDIKLNEVEGFAGGTAALDALATKIAAKQAELDSLRRTEAPTEPPLHESEEVA